MPIDRINNINIYWELTGEKGEPLILVHGSWGDHHNWDMVVEEFSKRFRVVTYDRRGHSQSERLPGQGYVEEDIDDLIALAEHLDLSPAHMVGNSYGAGIVLKTASKRPDLFKSLVAHQPPLFDLLKDDPGAQDVLKILNERTKTVLDLIANGQIEKATKEFMEKIAMGEGAWQKLPGAAQETFIHNAITWYDEMHDPHNLQIDIAPLSGFKKPALLSDGTESPVFFPLVIEKLVKGMSLAKRITIEGAGHVPHMSHSKKYIELVSDFCFAATAI